MTAASAIVALVTLPLAGVLLTVPLGRHGRMIGFAVVLGVLVAVAVLWAAVAQGATPAIAIGNWPAPLGIALRADGLAVACLAMTASVMLAVIVSASDQFGPPSTPPDERKARLGASTSPAMRAGLRETRTSWAFWPLTLLLWAALNVVFVSRDLFNLYVGLELLTLAAVALVALEGTVAALTAALRYMIFALMGSLFYLLGAALLYAGHGTLDLLLLGGTGIGSTPAAAHDLMAAGLMTGGLVVKTALFPFHAWLPPAHAGAPAPASAMLSALVPKASFVVLIRIWFEAMPDLATPALLTGLGICGAGGVIYGSVMALRQDRLKLIVAYSTVAQIGYLFLIFPLAGGESFAQPWAAGAWTGAIFQAISHGLAKAAMFLCAGVWVIAVGHDRLAGLQGLVRATPMTAFAFALAAVTLMGLPPSGGFTAKYLMLTAAFASGKVVWAAVLLLGGLLSAAYLYRPMSRAFRPDAEARFAPVPRRMQVAPLLLALAAIGLGLWSAPPFALLQVGRPAAAAEGLE